MPLRAQHLFLLLGLPILFSACQQQQEGISTYPLSDNMREWLQPFAEIDKTFNYRNDAGDLAQVMVKIYRPPGSETGIPTNVDCSRNGEIAQCEIESVILGFPSDADTTVFLAFDLLAEDRLYQRSRTDGGLGDAIVSLFENTNEFTNSLPEAFTGTYDANTHTITVENTVEEGYLYLGKKTPKAFTLVKGQGITQWTDYDGKVWIMEE